MSKDEEVKTSKSKGLMNMVSTLTSRLGLAMQAGMQFGGKRDLYSVFGYPAGITPEQVMNKYIRQDITSRIVDAPPGATWGGRLAFTTDVAESKVDEEFTKKWAEADRQFSLMTNMYRVDRLARMGFYSLLLFGFSGQGKTLDKPVKTREGTKLLYIRPIAQAAVTHIEVNNDPTNERFGKPEYYSINFKKVTTAQSGATATNIIEKKLSLNSVRIHHSHVVHVVENALEDEYSGTPIMHKVYNLLEDLIKVVGGAAEVFWLNSNKGMQADLDKEMNLTPEDADDLEDEIDDYQHELRRVIKTRGVTLKDLGGHDTNPQQTFNMLMSMISGATGIPRRILTGSEAGQLASEQDRANWAERIDERRALYAEPRVLFPVLAMLALVDLIPRQETVIPVWPSAFKLSPLETAMVMAQQARAIGNLSRQTGNSMPMPITSQPEARAIIGLKGKLDDTEASYIDTPAGFDASGDLEIEETEDKDNVDEVDIPDGTEKKDES